MMEVVTQEIVSLDRWMKQTKNMQVYFIPLGKAFGS